MQEMGDTTGETETAEKVPNKTHKSNYATHLMSLKYYIISQHMPNLWLDDSYILPSSQKLKVKICAHLERDEFYRMTNTKKM